MVRSAWRTVFVVLAAGAGAVIGCSSFGEAEPLPPVLPDAASDGPLDASIADAAACAITSGSGDGTVPAGETDCAGARVQLANSSRHCGACFHSCGKGPCNEGRCDPRIVSTDALAVAGALVVGADDDAVYWVRFTSAVDTKLVRHDLHADAGPMVLHTAAELISAVAFASARAYVGKAGGGPIVSVPLDGSPATPIVPSAIVSTLAADRDAVFYGNPTARHVRRVLPDGGDLRELATNEAKPTSLVVDDGAVYWLNTIEDGGVDGSSGTLVRYDRKLQTVARSAAAGRPSALAKDGAHLFVYDGESQELRRYRSGSVDGPETLMRWTGDVRPSATGILHDANFVYVLLTGVDASGVLVRVPRCGGAPLVLFRSPYSPGGIALGDDVVYMGSGSQVLAITR